MPVLLYCVIEACLLDTQASPGVRGENVACVDESGLHCLLSFYDDAERISAQPLREAALEFNRVLQRVLEHTAVIPFRFPTFLADEAAIHALLREHASEYRATLSRLRDTVQMEITLTADQARPEKSGKAYLQARRAVYQKLDQAAQTLEQGTKEFILAWRRREIPTGIRCYALVGRPSRESLEAAIRGTDIPADLQVRVTGPWPATEFLKES